MKLLLLTQPQKITVFIIAALAVSAAIIIAVKVIASKRVRYSLKSSYLTPTETKYYEALVRIAGDEFLVFPQINLAAVINKDSKGYRTELFRNADFGFFTRDFQPILLIEVNDSSHDRADRAERDKSVNKICKKAGLPLITFRTRDGVDENYMRKVVGKYLSRARR